MLKSIFVFSLCLFSLLLTVQATTVFHPCLNNPNPNVVDSSIAYWRKHSLNDYASEVNYMVCGITATVFSYITHAKLKVESSGVEVYSYSAKIREPSNKDINPNTYCFQGIMNVEVPYMDWPSDFSMSLDFYETDRDPILHLCSQGK